MENLRRLRTMLEQPFGTRKSSKDINPSSSPRKISKDKLTTYFKRQFFQTVNPKNRSARVVRIEAIRPAELSIAKRLKNRRC